jgi:hypothetical protein
MWEQQDSENNAGGSQGHIPVQQYHRIPQGHIPTGNSNYENYQSNGMNLGQNYDGSVGDASGVHRSE